MPYQVAYKLIIGFVIGGVLIGFIVYSIMKPKGG
jgi:hypothetical protein